MLAVEAVVGGDVTRAEFVALSGDVYTLSGEVQGKQNLITSNNKLDYSLLSSTPGIPTKTSDLTNDDGFITASALDGYALESEIPTVNNSTVTFTQGGVNKGSITLNQSTSATIEFDAGGRRWRRRNLRS